MVRVLSRVLIVSALLAAAPLAQAQEVPVAVIDVQRVLTESDPGKESLQKLQVLQEEKIEEGRQLQSELEALQDQISKQRLTLSQEKLDALRQQIEDQQVEMKRFQEDAQREIDTARRDALQKLEARVMPIIQKIGEEKGYLLIFQKYQAGLAFAAEETDITDEVIRRFNTAK